MFENIIETSIFVRILIFAFISILAINLVATLINTILDAMIRRRGTE